MYFVQQFIKLSALRAFLSWTLWEEKLIDGNVKQCNQFIKHLQAGMLSVVLN